MPDTDVVSTITLRLVSDITEQLTRDEAAITSFAARVDALKASNLGAITAPSAGGSSATYAESLIASNGAARVATNGSTAYTSALEKEIAATIAVADAHEAEAAKVIASSERIMATSQGRVAQVARTLTVEKAAADAGVSSNSLLGREFLRLGDTANIAGAKLRVFDSLGIGLAGNITLLGAAITALSVKDFADFQQKMQQLGANTGLTRTQISSLTGTIIQMGTTTPTSLAELADGFRHILSEGYGLRDSVLVAKAALDAADATGASFADTASTVATEMHNWGDSASKAAQDTGALLVAAQRGNTDLQGLVGALSKVGVEMSSIHQPMADAVSIVSEFSRATGDPAIAGTWAAAMIAHIINPTKQAITVMGELKTTTGVDLQKAFAQFSAGQINFTTLMQEAQQATHGNAQEIMALFGGLRGGLGALQLLHGGLQQYIDTQAKASDGAAELAKQAAAAHDNLLFKFGVAVNIVKIATVDFGGVINTVIDDLGGLIAKFDSLPGPLKSAVSLMAGAFNPFVAAGTAAIGVVDLVRGATDKHTESIKQQIAALQKEKASLENTTTSNQGYRLGAENSDLATHKLADVTKQLADLQRLAADRANEHTAALNRQALTMQSLAKLAFWAPQPTVYIPPKDSDIASMIASARQRVATDTNRLAYDRQFHPASVAGDEAELAKAKAALAKWDDALGKSSAGVDDWTAQYSAAQKTSTDAAGRVALKMYDLAQHIPNDMKSLPVLEEKADQAAKKLYLMSEASDIAAKDFVAAAALAKTAYEKGAIGLGEAVRLQKLANTATEAVTQKDWLLSFAAGDAATKSKMLADAFSGLISRASTVTGAQSSVDNANIGVIAAQSAVQVGLLQSEVTATSDLGGIISAQTGVQTAIGNQQIARINDGVAITQASYDVQAAHLAIGQALLSGDAQQLAAANAGLKIAQDHLVLARATAAADQENARWAIRIAEDQAVIAADKLSTDNANAAVQAKVLVDHLAVAKDAVQIALDQQKLTLDSLVVLQDISHATSKKAGLPVKDYGQLIRGDLAAILRDQGTSARDAAREAADQAAANVIAAHGGQTMANAQNAASRDQGAGNTVSQDAARNLAALKAHQAATEANTAAQQAETAALIARTSNAGQITLLNGIVDIKSNNAAGLLAAGQTTTVPPGSAADKRREAQRRAEGLPDDRPSTYDTDINAAVAAKIEAGKKTDARTRVDAAVDSGAGDAAGAYSLLLPLYQKGAITLTDFLGTAKAAATETDNQTQRTIALDVALGDFIGAAGLAKTAYLDGKESLADYVSIQKQANAETATRLQKEIAADVALGDFPAAAAAAKKAYEDGTGSFEEAVRLGKLGNAATAKTTQMDWDLAFATGDAATKSQMLSAAFSGLISQASTIAGAQAAVDNAKLGVIAADSAVQVQLLQSEVTATQDLGGIITAQAGIQKAISDGQISAINDSTTIMQSSYGVEVAQAAVQTAMLTGNSLTIAIANAGLKVAQDTLQIDRVTAEMDAANARWSIRLAEDSARLAMDKLITDNANSAATARVLMDHLAVAKDAVDIALAQQKLTLDSMVILANIDSTLGGVTDYRDLITGDLAGLDKAQKQSTADQYKEAYDQANANQIAAQGGLTLAGDQNSLNSDQASAASVSQQFLLELADLKKTMAKDTISQQQLQALQNIAKTASELLAATTATDDILKRIERLNNEGLQGLQRIDVTGSSTASMTNGLGAQMAQNPTHG